MCRTYLLWGIAPTVLGTERWKLIGGGKLEDKYDSLVKMGLVKMNNVLS